MCLDYLFLTVSFCFLMLSCGGGHSFFLKVQKEGSFNENIGKPTKSNNNEKHLCCENHDWIRKAKHNLEKYLMALPVSTERRKCIEFKTKDS